MLNLEYDAKYVKKIIEAEYQKKIKIYSIGYGDGYAETSLENENENENHVIEKLKTFVSKLPGFLRIQGRLRSEKSLDFWIDCDSKRDIRVYSGVNYKLIDEFFTKYVFELSLVSYSVPAPQPL